MSKVAWKLLLAKHRELRHIKAYKSQPFNSKRNSGRYRPYSNVDSFLKVNYYMPFPFDRIRGKNCHIFLIFNLEGIYC